MGDNRQRRRAGHPWRILLALICVLLVVVGATVQVAHTHADGTVAHADCSLCAVAHTAVHLAQTPIPAPAFAVPTILEAAPPSVVPVALSTFALFTRPPPVDFVPA